MEHLTLLFVLIHLAMQESPTLLDGKHLTYLVGLDEMARHYTEVGSAGALVSPEFDPYLLAAVGYEESRHRPKSRDGDCHQTLDGRKTCSAIGPMQLSTATPSYLPRIVSGWDGITVEKLRDPLTNVRAAYAVLGHWKRACGGTPARWLGSYMAGRCATIPAGLRREKLMHKLTP